MTKREEVELISSKGRLARTGDPHKTWPWKTVSIYQRKKKKEKKKGKKSTIRKDPRYTTRAGQGSQRITINRSLTHNMNEQQNFQFHRCLSSSILELRLISARRPYDIRGGTDVCGRNAAGATRLFACRPSSACFSPLRVSSACPLPLFGLPLTPVSTTRTERRPLT